MLIVLEGIDGSGKTSLSLGLELKNREISKKDIELVHWFSFVDYPDELEKLAFAGVKRLKAAHVLDPIPNSLWHAADFATRWSRYVTPAMKAGKTVVFDRSMYSALVRDGLRGVDQNRVRAMYEHFVLPPDLIIYLDLPVEMAAKRKGDNIAYYEAGMDLAENKGLSKLGSFIAFQKKCQIAYKKILPSHTLVIDASQPKEQVLDIALKAIIELAKKKNKKCVVNKNLVMNEFVGNRPWLEPAHV